MLRTLIDTNGQNNFQRKIKWLKTCGIRRFFVSLQWKSVETVDAAAEVERDSSDEPKRLTSQTQTQL
jgi:hypothetical protein